MSNGLMSCVRENSPPLEMAGNDSGAFSLPSSSTSSDQNKRRRFHPLRNLRRIFRRRTMTSTDASTSSSNIPALTATTTNSNLTQSSPTSPLSQQQQLQYNLLVKSPTVLTIPTTTTSTVPAHNYPNQQHHQQNSPSGILLSSNDITITQSLTTTTATTTSVTSIGRTPAGGIQVIPQFSTNPSLQLSPSSAGGFFMHKQSDKIILKLKNNHYHQQGCGGSTNDFHNNNDNNIDNNNEDCIGSSGEMTDNQRSFSEGRLVDSDFNRDSLSQSHDSVFSESATAGSLSLGLKNELFDVLRKRRNRSDASDEDLGLPHSPTILSQENQNITSQNNINNDNDITISNLMMISSDLEGDDLLGDHTISSISSSKMSSSFDGSKTSDEIDMSITGGITRLSHSAARHKMAVRPNKKKGPTRHRKPIDSTNLPSTPEVNEEYMKSALTELKDFNDKIKSRSLPPGVNAKILEQHSSSSNSKDIKRSKTEKVSSQNEYNSVGNISKTIIESNKQTQQTSVFSVTSTEKKDDSENGFFRRFLHRNSKRNQKKQQSQDELDNNPKDHTIYKDSKITQKSEQKTINEYSTLSSHSQRVEETRQDIRREILSEAQAGMSLMLNSFILSTSEHSHSEEVNQHEENVQQQTNLSSYKSNKPKSGPAARQRVMPKDLTNLVPPVVVVDFINSEKKSSSEFITHEKSRPHRLSDESDSSSCGGLNTPKSILKISNEHLNSNPSKIEIVKHTTQLSNEDIKKSSTEEIAFKLHSTIKENTESVVDKEHFEKREHRIHPPKIVALSPFQQKISRSEAFQLDYACPPVAKPRKSVEKSKSFRYYSEGQDIEIDTKLKKYDNMPSLPDLSFVRKSSFENIIDDEAETSVSLGFEINDNNLITLRSNEEPFPLSQGIFTKNIILTTTSKIKPNKNITEIEESIDKLLIKSQPPFVPIMKKSTSIGDAMEIKLNPNISITPIKKSETFNQKSENPKTDKEVIMNEFAIIKMSEMTQSMPCKHNNSGDISPILKNSIDFNETYKSKIDIISKSADSICPRVDTHKNNSPKSSAITKARRSSSTSSEKPECHGIPEFMKIQLNRVVDPCRPKSNIVLAKNIKTLDNGSNQDVKINDTIEITENKPPLPPLPIDLKRNSLISTSVKDDTIITPIKTITSNDNDSPPIVLRTTENMLQPNLFERRKSVTDEKLKYEKKIEELKSERKKSITEETTRKTEQIIENRKSSIDDDQISCNNNNNGVILRKKSFGLIQTTVSPIPQQLTSNNNDPTPELMKVFARRSLKIKDDELQPFDEIDKTPTLLKKFTNLDSDKENQSSSEEKLDKLPKIELTIQSQQKPILLQQYKNDEKLRNSLVDLRKANNNTSNLTNNSSNNNNNNNNSLTSTPTKTFNRYSSNNIVNYNRNNITTSTILSNKKMTTSQNNSPTITEQFSITTMAGTRSSLTTTTTTTATSNEQNNNLMNDKSTIRHTIGPSNPTNLENKTVDNEFKGILQRRAEWEKRAKEALK